MISKAFTTEAQSTQRKAFFYVINRLGSDYKHLASAFVGAALAAKNYPD